MGVEMEIPTAGAIPNQLPEIRRVTTLDDLRKVLPPKPYIPPAKKVISIKKTTNYAKNIILSLAIAGLFVGLVVYGITVLRKRDELNKRLYQIAKTNKDKTIVLENKLQFVNNVKDSLINSRKAFLRNYLISISQQEILQSRVVRAEVRADKEKKYYRSILLSKTSLINSLRGELRVVSVKADAMKAQNELLAQEFKRKDNYISELTTKLVYNIDQQEILMKEILKFKKGFAPLDSNPSLRKDSTASSKDKNIAKQS